MSAYAVIKTGGKQYRVAEDDVIVIEKLGLDPGASVTFEDVLMLGGEGQVQVGAPRIDGATVLGEVLDERRGEKVLVFKKHRRKNYRRTKGHRQTEAIVRITAISPDGSAKPKKAKKAPPPPPTDADAAPAPVKFLDAPDGDVDDLKKISGVGPALEKKLHGLGVYHYAQIAAFTDEDVARVDEVLNFKGRIERDDWRGQAAALAAGETPAKPVKGDDDGA